MCAVVAASPCFTERSWWRLCTRFSMLGLRGNLARTIVSLSARPTGNFKLRDVDLIAKHTSLPENPTRHDPVISPKRHYGDEGGGCGHGTEISNSLDRGSAVAPTRREFCQRHHDIAICTTSGKRLPYLAQQLIAHIKSSRVLELLLILCRCLNAFRNFLSFLRSIGLRTTFCFSAAAA